MTTCVVTGGAGFLGSHLCEHLLGKGHRVLCLDNLETGSLENIAHIRDEKFEFRHTDITEYVDVPEPVALLGGRLWASSQIAGLQSEIRILRGERTPRSGP